MQLYYHFFGFHVQNNEAIVEKNVYFMGVEFHAKILVGLFFGQDPERTLESDDNFGQEKNKYHCRESNPRLLVSYVRWMKYFVSVIY